MVVRVLLLEDHAIFRELFASAFDQEPGFEVVAQAGTLAGARQALEELGEGGVDVAVLDLRLPDGDGTDLIGEPRGVRPGGSGGRCRCHAQVGQRRGGHGCDAAPGGGRGPALAK
jgi:CheY-like chemotaxis protein